jgi:hypothetical protein
MTTLVAVTGGLAMRTFFGMILGAALLGLCVYAYDSYQTSSLANGDVAQSSRTIVNWDVVATDWHALKTRAHEDWVRISQR